MAKSTRLKISQHVDFSLKIHWSTVIFIPASRQRFPPIVMEDLRRTRTRTGRWRTGVFQERRWFKNQSFGFNVQSTVIFITGYGYCKSLNMLAFKIRVSNCLSVRNAFGSISVSWLRAKKSFVRLTRPAKTFSSSRFRWFRSRLTISTAEAPRKAPGCNTEISFWGRWISVSWRCFRNRPDGSSGILFPLTSTTNRQRLQKFN